MKKNAAGFGRILSNNLFLLGLAFQSAPLYTLHRILKATSHNVIVFFEHVYMIGFTIDAIQFEQPFSGVLLFIGSMFLFVTLYTFVWGNIVEYRIRPEAEEKINRRIREALYRKAAEIDLGCYDDPVYYNDFVWAMSEADTRVYAVLDTLSMLFGGVASVLLIGSYILSQDGAGLLFVAVSFVGIFFVGKKSNRVNLDIRERMKPHERRRDYTARVFYLADHAKEIRLNRVKQRLLSDFDESVENLNREIRRGSGKLAALQFASRFVFSTFVMEGAYLPYLLYRTIVQKAFGYGTMVTMYRSCGMIRSGFHTISQALPALQENSLYIEKIRGFLAAEPRVTSPGLPAPLPASGEFELRDVTFSYNGEPVLKNINLAIKNGERVAFVGRNGAGKTTLVKLLMRLYDPDGGEIRYGGRNIRDYSLNEYRALFGTVFQDYQLFAATVRENIVMDTAEAEDARVLEAARRGGFAGKLATLPKGLDTEVTREFADDGVLFSGGEAQSLVISRALYRGAPVIILDEPSSALDPIAEYEQNRTMMEENRGRTVVLISHRLSTTKNADRIVLLDRGGVAECGTHEELMVQNGDYAAMFNLQAEKYRRDGAPG